MALKEKILDIYDAFFKVNPCLKFSLIFGLEFLCVFPPFLHIAKEEKLHIL